MAQAFIKDGATDYMGKQDEYLPMSIRFTRPTRGHLSPKQIRARFTTTSWLLLPSSKAVPQKWEKQIAGMRERVKKRDAVM